MAMLSSLLLIALLLSGSCLFSSIELLWLLLISLFGVAMIWSLVLVDRLKLFKAEMQQANRQLQESEQRFRTLVEGSIQGILVHRNTRPLYVNQAYAQILGYDSPADIMMLDSVVSLIAPDEQERLLRYHAGRVKGEQVPNVYEYDAIRKDGSRVALAHAVTTIPWDGDLAVMATITDATERKQRENQVKQHNRELAALNSIISATNELLDPAKLSELLQIIVDRGAEALLADRMTLITFDVEHKTIIDFVKGGRGAQHVRVIPFNELWEGLSGWVLREGKPALSLKGVPDPRESALVQQRRAETNCGSIIVVPLHYQYKCLGTITVINQPNQPDFTEQSVELLLTIANQVAIVLEKIRLYQQIQQSTERLQIRTEQQAVVVELGQRALATTDLALFMQGTAAIVAQTLGMTCCMIWELLPSGTALQLQAGVGCNAAIDAHLIVAVEQGSQASYTLQSTEPVIMTDIHSESRFKGEPLLPIAGMASGMSFAIYGDGRSYGLLEMYTAHPRMFTSDDANFLQAVAHVLSAALYRHQATRALNEQQARLAGIIESAMDAIVTIDADQRIVLFNEAAEQMFQSPVILALGQPLEHFVPERLRSIHREHIQRFGQSNSARHTIDPATDVVGLRADGQEFSIEASISQIEVAGRKLYTAILRDITKRKKDEAAIQQLITQVSNGRMHLHRLSRRLVEVQEAERRHIAHELHDEIGQALTGLNLILEVGTQVSPDALKSRLGEAQALVNELTTRVRQLSLDLRPAMLDDLGLLPTLLWHVKRYTARTQVNVNFLHMGMDRRFPADVEITAYRAIQEALTNVARHAGVREATVRVWANMDVLGMQVEDHGIGFEPAAVLARHDSSGLAGIRERLLLLGGDLRIEATPGAGTSVTAELPLGGALERREIGR